MRMHLPKPRARFPGAERVASASSQSICSRWPDDTDGTDTKFGGKESYSLTIDARFRRRLWMYRVAGAVSLVQLMVVNDHGALWICGGLGGMLGGWILAGMRYRSWESYRAAAEAELIKIGRNEDFPTLHQRLRNGELFVGLALFPYQWLGLAACVSPIGVLGFLTRLDILRMRSGPRDESAR